MTSSCFSSDGERAHGEAAHIHTYYIHIHTYIFFIKYAVLKQVLWTYERDAFSVSVACVLLYTHIYVGICIYVSYVQ